MNFDNSCPETPWSRKSGSSSSSLSSSSSSSSPPQSQQQQQQQQEQQQQQQLQATSSTQYRQGEGDGRLDPSNLLSSPECALYLKDVYNQILHDISRISPLQTTTALCAECLNYSRQVICHVCHSRPNCSANFGILTIHATMAREYLGMIGHADQMRGIEQQPRWETEYGTPDDIDARTQYAKVVSYILAQHAAANKYMGIETSTVQDFDCAQGSLPSVTLYDYVLRLMRYAPATKELYVVSLILIDRMLSMNPGMIVSERNVHRLFAASIVVASKFLDDLFYTNNFFANIACIDVNELNNLEICFLVRIRFGLYIRNDLFISYIKPFEQIVSFARTNDDLYRFYSIVYSSYREKIIEQTLLQLQCQYINNK